VISTKLRHALEQYGDRVAVEVPDRQWQLSGAQLLGGAASLFETLAPHVDRPIVAYLHKSPVYYLFTACAFLHGVSYCPLDIEVPIERVLEVAGQLGGAIIVCDDHAIFGRLRERTANCLELAFPTSSANVGASPRGDASYYIATSGSTGVPKLVQVAQDRTAAFVDWAIPFYRIDREVRWAQFSSIGFDLSLVDFLSVLCGGGTLVSLSSRMDRLRPAKAVERAAITHWHSVPSMIPYFLREPGDAPPCRVFTFCGEPLMKADVESLAERYPDARIINTYGPTEGTLFCSFFEYHRGDASLTESSLPIGQPILPAWSFVLVPDAGALRLVIVSDNIADGYVGFDAPQFGVVDVLGTPMRAFDTGDYVRVVGTQLYFSHRRDGMVKIHGNRIDLGDVEAAAKKVGLVNAVALVVDDAIALVAEGDPVASTEVLAALARLLPRSALPTAIRFVASHPRTVNGKLDRRAIRDAIGRP
jgi:D-alanine--poly(phosphoribitol) ligase subunit 1